MAVSRNDDVTKNKTKVAPLFGGSGGRNQNFGHKPNLTLYPGPKILVTTPTPPKKGGYLRFIFCDVIVAAGGHVDFNLTHTTAGNLSRGVRSFNTVSFKGTECVGGL